MGSQEGEGNEEGEGETGQKMVPEESQADVSILGFWKWGNSVLFDMRNFNLDTGSYLHQTSAKDLATEER